MIDLSTLRRIPLFRDFTDEQLSQVLATVAERRFPKHQFIVREGEPGDTFFVIASGSVAVCRIAPDGRETILSILKEGDFFGEMSMFDSSLRSASIKTLTDVEVGAVRRDDFLGLIDRNPQIGKLLVIELSERLRAANALILGENVPNCSTMNPVASSYCQVLVTLPTGANRSYQRRVSISRARALARR